jgi:GNAT superfamily N-acetyltransferase
MKEETYRALDKFWAQDLGLDSGFDASPVRCVAQELHLGVQMLRRDGRLVIAAPPDKCGVIQAAIGGLSPAELFSVEWLQRVLGRDAVKILGPADISYADETSFRSALPGGARALSTADSEAYRLLQAALDPKEQEESGLTADKYPAFGAFSGDMLCAVASYSVWEPSIAHIVVASHPDHRRRGLASAAIKALAADALNRGLILQWRALAWNQPSLALARDLGFKHYCSTIYARLQPSEGDAPE